MGGKGGGEEEEEEGDCNIYYDDTYKNTYKNM